MPNKKKKNHFIQCKIKDLCYDPFREKVTTAWVRDFRYECKLCQQRFPKLRSKNHLNTIGNFKHKCCQDAKVQNKTLCLYCDKYFRKIWNHKKTCKTFKLYVKHKNLMLLNYFKKRRIFVDRVDKISKYLINQRRRQVSKSNVKIDQNNFRKFFEKYCPIVKSYEKSAKVNVIKKPEQVECRQRLFLKYDCFPISMALDFTVVKPILTNEDKEALYGMISWDKYIEREQQAENLRKKRRREILDENPEIEFAMKMHKLKLERLEEGHIINNQLENLNAIRSLEILTDQDISIHDESILAPCSSGSNTTDDCEFFYLKNNPKIKKFKLQAKQLYKKNFINFNKEMQNYLQIKKTILLVKKNILVGAMTFEVKSYKQIEYVDLLLIGVNTTYQRQGFGKILIKHLISRYDKIIAWVDFQAIEFYKKLGFREYETPKNHEEILTFMTDSTIMGHGLTNDLINSQK